MVMKIHFIRKSGGFRYRFDGDAGFDLEVPEGGVLYPGFSLIPTGIVFTGFSSDEDVLTSDMCLELRPRSGLSSKGILVFDRFFYNDLRSHELVVPVFNATGSPFSYDAGFRIAQCVVTRVVEVRQYVKPF